MTERSHPHVRVLGLDACKTGWVAIVADESGFLDAFTAPTIAEAEERGTRDFAATHLVVDIPIGIPDSGLRRADQLARRFVQPRGSSVFPTPVRAALEASTYADARAASVFASGKSLSAQAYAIRERILDADVHLAQARIRILEGHPEVSFREMAGSGIVHPKKSYAGAQLRLELLEREGISVPTPLERSLRGAAWDDVLDAAAMAWSAHRVAQGKAQRFPAAAEAQRFSDGNDSAIWF